ncbi:MAG: hypothetical protein MUF15_15980 [Acidobacteria bacterium]|nr:hypothetical protein [Acidobacteriota bacterium]
MKIGNSVSISDLEKGTKIAAVVILMPLLLIIAISPVFAAHRNFSNLPSSLQPLQGIEFEKNDDLKNYRIDHIYFEYEQRSDKRIRLRNSDEYELLLAFKHGDNFNYKKNRENITALYKTGLFSDVKVEIEKFENNRLDIYYIMGPLYIVGNVQIVESGGIKKNHIINAILSGCAFRARRMGLRN